MPRTIGPLATALALVVVISGCGGTEAKETGTATTTAKTTSAKTETSTAPKPVKPKPTAPTYSAEGTAENPDGDRIRVGIKVGKPQLVADLHDRAINACADMVIDAGSSSERSIAVPVSMRAAVTSSLATDVVVNLREISRVSTGGNAAPLLGLQVPILWGWRFSDGPACTGAAQLSAGRVRWDAQSPSEFEAGAESGGWIILPGEVSPKHPKGKGSANRLLLQPTVEIGGADPQPLAFKTSLSPALVQCTTTSSTNGEQNTVSYVALDSKAAVSRGCS